MKKLWQRKANKKGLSNDCNKQHNLRLIFISVEKTPETKRLNMQAAIVILYDIANTV